MRPGPSGLRLLDTQVQLKVTEELRMESGPEDWIWPSASGRREALAGPMVIVLALTAVRLGLRLGGSHSWEG